MKNSRAEGLLNLTRDKIEGKNLGGEGTTPVTMALVRKPEKQKCEKKDSVYSYFCYTPFGKMQYRGSSAHPTQRYMIPGAWYTPFKPIRLKAFRKTRPGTFGTVVYSFHTTIRLKTFREMRPDKSACHEKLFAISMRYFS